MKHKTYKRRKAVIIIIFIILIIIANVIRFGNDRSDNPAPAPQAGIVSGDRNP